MGRCGCILALALAMPAIAGERASDVALEPLSACRAIVDAAARLGCYDAAVGRLRQAIGNRRIVAVDSSVSTAALPSAPAAQSRPGDRDRFIDSTVESATRRGNDDWSIRLADGSRWRTTQPGLGQQPAVGAEARIRPGPIGGYLLQIGRGAKVHVLPEKKRP